MEEFHSQSSLDYLPPMPKDKTTGIGCVGSGFIMANCHLVAYRKVGFNPVAIASKSAERARQVANRHGIPNVYSCWHEMLHDPRVEVLDIAVPPDMEMEVVREAVCQGDHIRGILAQKPLGCSFAEAKEMVNLCAQSGIRLAVNQNMRYDQSIRACKRLLDRGDLGEPILATIEMRAIPHWMPWHERLGFLTLRNMSIHHLDAFRFLFGDPERIFASARPDPRCSFPHEDGICLYILEYTNGLRATAWDDIWVGPAQAGERTDTYIHWRVEGHEGVARGTIGWPSYPAAVPSTLDFMTSQEPDHWFRPRWKEVWFPDAFVGTMAQLLCAIEEDCEPEISGSDNLKTMALIDAGYRSSKEHRAVSLEEIIGASE